MAVTMYGKASCKKCQAAKLKMALMEIPFHYVDLEDFENWRGQDNGAAAREGMAEYNFRDAEELPLFLVYDRWFDYPEAMAYFKKGGAV